MNDYTCRVITGMENSSDDLSDTKQFEDRVLEVIIAKWNISSQWLVGVFPNIYIYYPK